MSGDKGEHPWKCEPVDAERREVAGDLPELCYGIPDFHDEVLCCDCATAVEEYLDELGKDAPDRFRVSAFRRMKIETTWLERNILENMKIHLVENYGDGHHTPEDWFAPTEPLKARVKELMDTVRSEYRSWNCEPAPEYDIVVTVGDEFYALCRRQGVPDCAGGRFR